MGRDPATELNTTRKALRSLYLEQATVSNDSDDLSQDTLWRQSLDCALLPPTKYPATYHWSKAYSMEPRSHHREYILEVFSDQVFVKDIIKGKRRNFTNAVNSAPNRGLTRSQVFFTPSSFIDISPQYDRHSILLQHLLHIHHHILRSHFLYLFQQFSTHRKYRLR